MYVTNRNGKRWSTFWRDERNTLIYPLIEPERLNNEREEHKTKDLKNKGTVDDKNSINSKGTSKIDKTMASKNAFVDSTDFHVPLPFPYHDQE